jgi:hypothetical protein
MADILAYHLKICKILYPPRRSLGPGSVLNLTHRILYNPRLFQKPKVFSLYFLFFAVQAKQHLCQALIIFMRQLRKLGQNVWYEIRTGINNREPLFRRAKAMAIFARVFREAGLRFVFEVRSLHLEDDWLTFYIKPENGFELPDIMKWMKQVFAQRFNAMTGRIGHIWGDRYWSRILEGEPPEVAGEEEPAPGDRPHGRRTASGDRPCGGGKKGKAGFPLISPPLSPG